MSATVFIDFGGTKIKYCSLDEINNPSELKIVCSKSIENINQIVDIIIGQYANITKLAISICGRVNAESSVYDTIFEWLNGQNINTFRELFACEEVMIINDGEAHALSVVEYNKKHDNIDFGCICFSFGTYIGLGILNVNQELIKACDLGNLDIAMGRDFNNDLAYLLHKMFKPKTFAVSGGRAKDDCEMYVIKKFAENNNIKFVNLTTVFDEGALVGMSTLYNK